MERGGSCIISGAVCRHRDCTCACAFTGRLRPRRSHTDFSGIRVASCRQRVLPCPSAKKITDTPRLFHNPMVQYVGVTDPLRRTLLCRPADRPLFRQRPAPCALVAHNVSGLADKRFGHSPDKHSYEAHGRKANRHSQHGRTCPRRNNRNMARTQRLRRMGHRMADAHSRISQIVDPLDHRTMEAYGQFFTASFALFLWHRLADAAHIVSQHIVSQHLFLCNRQPQRPHLLRLLHTERQMEQDGHHVNHAGSHIVFPAGTVGRAGRCRTVRGNGVENKPLHQLHSLPRHTWPHAQQR